MYKGDLTALQPVQHLKTGNVYYLIDVAIDATNSTDGRSMMIYCNNDRQIFVRELEEFYDKFDLYECNK